MSDRQKNDSGKFKKRRGDTRIDTIEEEYGVDFDVRGDMRLDTYLEDSGAPSLSKALKKLKK